MILASIQRRKTHLKQLSFPTIEWCESHLLKELQVSHTSLISLHTFSANQMQDQKAPELYPTVEVMHATGLGLQM